MTFNKLEKVTKMEKYNKIQVFLKQRYLYKLKFK